MSSRSLSRRRQPVSMTRGLGSFPGWMSRGCLCKPLLGTVQMLVVGPFSPDDYGIVLQLLKTAPRSCLLLSKEQLRELTPDAVKALMRATDLVILNELEAAIWSGCDDLRDAVRKFRDEIGGDILITTHRYVLGHVGGDPVYNKAFEPRAVAQEPGSGDVFTSTLVSMLVDHHVPIDQAVDLALAAALLHVEGDSNPGALDRMRLVVQDRPRAKVPRNHFTTGESRKQRTPAVAAAAAAGLLLALGWGVGQML